MNHRMHAFKCSHLSCKQATAKNHHLKWISIITFAHYFVNNVHKAQNNLNNHELNVLKALCLLERQHSAPLQRK